MARNQALPSDGRSKDATASMTYESAMQELETLVQRMEQGDVPLEESLQAFERGRNLVARCKGILDDAQKRIVQLDLDQLQAGDGGA